MKKICLFVIILFCVVHGFGQSIKKYPIGETGCAAYFFCDPGTFNLSYSEDSSKIYMGECLTGETYYGLICVQLNQSISKIAEAEDVMLSYLDYLKTAFKVTSAAGYGKGHRLRNKENIHGIIDYWKDESGINLKVKGWTDGNFIMVLYAKSAKELVETKANVFLDGIIFKGM